MKYQKRYQKLEKDKIYVFFVRPTAAFCKIDVLSI